MSSGWYLVLPSNSSLNVYPNNTVASYQTKLQTPVSLDGEWECALFELEYTRSWQNIEVGDSLVHFTYQKKDESHYTHTFTIPPGFYETTEEIGIHFSHGFKNVPDCPKKAIYKYAPLIKKFAIT